MSMFYRGKPLLRSCENLFDNDLSILCTLAQSSCMQVLYSFHSSQTITNLRKPPGRNLGKVASIW